MKEKTSEPIPMVVMEWSEKHRTMIFMLDEGDSMPWNTSTNYDYYMSGPSLVYKTIDPRGGHNTTEHFVNNFEEWQWIDMMMHLGQKYPDENPDFDMQAYREETRRRREGYEKFRAVSIHKNKKAPKPDYEEIVNQELGLMVVLDPDEYFPDDPGQGTPVLVVKLDKHGEWDQTSTWFCATEQRELDEYQLSDEEYEWIDAQHRKVMEFYQECADWKPGNDN